METKVYTAISLLMIGMLIGGLIYGPDLLFGQASTGGSGVDNPTYVYTLNVNDEYTLPTTDGTNGQVLTTDGAGTITFEDGGGGGDDEKLAVDSGDGMCSQRALNNARYICRLSPIFFTHRMALYVNMPFKGIIVKVFEC